MVSLINSKTAFMMSALRSLSKVKQPYNNVSKVITEIKLSALKKVLALVFEVSTFEKVIHVMRCFKVSVTTT